MVQASQFEFSSGALRRELGTASASEQNPAKEDGLLACETSLNPAVDLDSPGDFDDEGDSLSADEDDDAEYLTVLAAAVAAAKRSGDLGHAAQARYWQTVALIQKDMCGEAREAAEDSARLCRALGDQCGEAQALLALGIIEINVQRPNEALAQADEAWCLARLCGDEDLENKAQQSYCHFLAMLESLRTAQQIDDGSV